MFRDLQRSLSEETLVQASWIVLGRSLGVATLWLTTPARGVIKDMAVRARAWDSVPCSAFRECFNTGAKKTFVAELLKTDPQEDSDEFQRVALHDTASVYVFYIRAAVRRGSERKERSLEFLGETSNEQFGGARASSPAPLPRVDEDS